MSENKPTVPAETGGTEIIRPRAGRRARGRARTGRRIWSTNLPAHH
jgi:hypothetical protein